MSKFQGMLLTVLTFVVLLLLAFTPPFIHALGQNIPVRKYVSEIYAIDGNSAIGQNGNFNKSFYIKTEVDPSFAVYICYLSQLDAIYEPSNKSLQIRAGFTLHNRKNNEIAEQCNPTMHALFKDTIHNIPQPNAWHGLKVEMLEERENNLDVQIVVVQTSFSEEQFHLYQLTPLEGFPSKSIQIHVGTPEEPLFTLYKGIKPFKSKIPENSRLPLIPRINALDGITNIRDSFQANPGAWMIPMDIARLEMYNNIGPTRMLYFVAICEPRRKTPKIAYVMDDDKDRKENEVKFDKMPVKMRNATVRNKENKTHAGYCSINTEVVKPAKIRDIYMDKEYEETVIRIGYVYEEENFMDVDEFGMQMMIESTLENFVTTTDSDAQKWLKKNYDWITEIELGKFYYAKLDRHSDVVVVNFLTCRGYTFAAGYVEDINVHAWKGIVEERNDWSKDFDSVNTCEHRLMPRIGEKTEGDGKPFATETYMFDKLEKRGHHTQTNSYTKIGVQLRNGRTKALTMVEHAAHEYKFGYTQEPFPIREHLKEQSNQCQRYEMYGEFVLQRDYMYMFPSKKIDMYLTFAPLYKSDFQVWDLTESQYSQIEMHACYRQSYYDCERAGFRIYTTRFVGEQTAILLGEGRMDDGKIPSKYFNHHVAVYYIELWDNTVVQPRVQLGKIDLSDLESELCPTYKVPN